MFIWSPTYKMVVYIPRGCDGYNTQSLSYWLVPNADGDEI